MKRIRALLHHRIVRTTGAALLAIVAVPAIVGLVLKALGLLHGVSLHTWPLDVGHNVPPIGAVPPLPVPAPTPDPTPTPGSTPNPNPTPDPTPAPFPPGDGPISCDPNDPGPYAPPLTPPDDGPKYESMPQWIKDKGPFPPPDDGGPGGSIQDQISQANDLADGLRVILRGGEQPEIVPEGEGVP
jgi:hypothetical protein